MKLSIVTVVFILLFVGCKQGVFEIISRSQNDPNDFRMKVSSFAKENEIQCSWDADPCCDEYILMRSEDLEQVKFSEVYRGVLLGYKDNVVMQDTRYLYALYKRRGQRIFLSGKRYLGIGSSYVDDAFEPNNSKESASELEEDKRCSLYYYKSYGGEILCDVDWYKVRLAARRTAYISIRYDKGGVQTPFKVYLEYNNSDIEVGNQTAFTIVNDGNYARYFYFKVYPNYSLFLSDEHRAGGRYEIYTLRLNKIE